ncbi:MAG: hypothetical protein ACI9F2_000844 [Lysobacterales bacterium]|jgi:hypothetical protein
MNLKRNIIALVLFGLISTGCASMKKYNDDYWYYSNYESDQMGKAWGKYTNDYLKGDDYNSNTWRDAWRTIKNDYLRAN